MTVARGVHFTSMGHSVQRPSPAGKSRKRLELLPEETLYLMEKGALFCWKASRDNDDDDTDEPGPEEDEREVEWDSASQGAPMSVQQAYGEMIGREHLTLDRYQVLWLVCLFFSLCSPKGSIHDLNIFFRIVSLAN